MDNRYQSFLKNTLKPGLLTLLEQPNLEEILGLSRSTFEIFIKAFRSSLPAEILKVLPKHELKNRDYLELLIGQVDKLLVPEADEEQVLANLPPMENLLLAYEEAKRLQTAASSQRLTWQLTFGEQVKKYNHDLIYRLNQQFAASLPSLSAGEREILVRDISKTIEDQIIKPTTMGPSANLGQDVQEVVETTLKTFASTAGEIAEKPEIVAQIAEDIALAETAIQAKAAVQKTLTNLPPEAEIVSLWDVKNAQLNATGRLIDQVEADLRISLTANLPAEVYRQTPAAIEKISERILGRLSLPFLANQPNPEAYQTALAAEIAKIIASPEIRQIIEVAGPLSSLGQKNLENLPANVSTQVGEFCQTYAKSAEAPLVGSEGAMAAPAPTTMVAASAAGAPAAGGPPLPEEPPRPNSPDDVFFSQGSPGHFLAALASPHTGEAVLTWFGRGGPLLMPLGFLLDSIPGRPKLDYLLDLFGPNLERYEQGFKNLERTALTTPGLTDYERELMKKEAQIHLAVIKEMKEMMEKKPWLKRLYQASGWANTLLHPLRFLSLKIQEKSLPAGVAFSALTDSVSAYLHYGPVGGSMVTGQVLTNLAGLPLKMVLAHPKIGLYGVVGPYPHRHYVFKPTHQLKLKIKEKIFSSVVAKFAGGAKKILSSLLAKLGLSAVGLLTGIGVILPFVKAVWDKTKKIIGGLLGVWVMNNWQKIVAFLEQADGVIKGLGIDKAWGITLRVLRPLGQSIVAAWKFTWPIIWQPIVNLATRMLGALVRSAVATWQATWPIIWQPIFRVAGSLIKFVLNTTVNLLSHTPTSPLAVLRSLGVIAPDLLRALNILKLVKPVLLATGATVIPTTIFVTVVTSTAFNEAGEVLAPIFFADCRVSDIHQTTALTTTNKDLFVAKYSVLFSSSLLKNKIDEVISAAKAANLNPALVVAIWGEESHFSNYGSKVNSAEVLPGYDFGCGTTTCSSDNQPKDFNDSLTCLAGTNAKGCNNACLSKPDFASFMECYGPAAQNPNFISNVLAFYRELVPTGPDALVCPGGTTGEFASGLIRILVECYDNGGVIDQKSLKDRGRCLRERGVTQRAVFEITDSVATFEALQCVGFAQAVETATGGKLQEAGYHLAKDFYFNPVLGYQQIPASQKDVRKGDIAVWGNPADDRPGHMGVVIEVAPDMSKFRIAEAIGSTRLANQETPYGLVRDSSYISIFDPYLLGFLRRKP